MTGPGPMPRPQFSNFPNQKGSKVVYQAKQPRTDSGEASDDDENRFEDKKEKLTQFGKRVWNLSGLDEEIAKMAIVKTEEFFQSLGVKTRLSEYTGDYQKAPKTIRSTFESRGWNAMGERQAITPEQVELIVEASF